MPAVALIAPESSSIAQRTESVRREYLSAERAAASGSIFRVVSACEPPA
jgi:hypothetical protein